MNRMVVIGGGGHAKVVISVLKKLAVYQIAGYTDRGDKGDILGVPYLGPDEVLGKMAPCGAAIGVGSVLPGNTRELLKNLIESLGLSLPPVVSRDAVVNEQVAIGRGSQVFDGAVVNSGVRIGECVILNTNSTVDHDCEIGDFVHVAPGATLSGGVRVGRNSLIGTGASVIQNIRIGQECVIGAGATVVEDILKRGIYAGNPARRIR
jgi:sugar O-acyltransferase (sialic acid O-acetyltransferase NeuD family)